MGAKLEPNGEWYPLVRWGDGHSPVYQRDNECAPARRGYWAFFRNFHTLEIVSNADKRRRIEFSVHRAELIYCGWDRNGDVTRSGFFNYGDWQCMTVDDAAKGLRKLIAYASRHGSGRGLSGWTTLIFSCSFPRAPRSGLSKEEQ